MAKYAVVIRATITKHINVEAIDEDEAYVIAHEQFSCLCTDEDENYEEETLDVYEV